MQQISPPRRMQALGAFLCTAWMASASPPAASAAPAPTGGHGGAPATTPPTRTVTPAATGGAPRVECDATTIGTFKRDRRPEVAVRLVPAAAGALVYEAGLAIDADGGRHAYRDDDKGLDTIRNACPTDRTKLCYGILERTPGNRVKQAPPNEAYYVSPTTLVDKSKPESDQDRYVDSERVAYVVLPLRTLTRMAAAKGGAALPLRLGDLAFVRNRKNGKSAFAIFADVGPAQKIGEGSIALADALQIPSSPRHGGAGDGVQVVVFPGSGDRRPKPQVDIDREGRAALERWGGPARLDACFADPPR
jgi:hypothetical protein